MVLNVKLPISQYLSHFKALNGITIFLNYIQYEKYIPVSQYCWYRVKYYVYVRIEM